MQHEEFQDLSTMNQGIRRFTRGFTIVSTGLKSNICRVNPNSQFNPVTMTKNLITNSVIALAIPALISLANPVSAECISCKTENTSISYKATPNNLVRLNSGNGFLLSNTAPESPFISQQSYLFIEELGRVYFEKCKEKKIGEWPFVITSVNIAKENVDNINVSATAINISWVRFGKEELQSQAHLNTLIDALMEMRDKETCFVKFEGKKASFHVLINETKMEGLAVAKR